MNTESRQPYRHEPPLPVRFAYPRPIDVVYTWVNDRDPAWQHLYAGVTRSSTGSARLHVSANDAGRFANHQELYYSVRSIQMCAPWVRNIFVVTNCRLPDWASAVPNLVCVNHGKLFPEGDDLPTFNSHAIETVLHRIEGLAEHFLYFNDDFFLCQHVQPKDFLRPDGSVYYFPSHHAIPYDRAPALLRPVDTGAINAARLLEQDFEYRPRWKLQHSPYALLKSVLTEIEARHPHEIAATRSHRFRHPDDVAMATTLHAYYAECTGHAQARDIATRYVDIGDWRFLGLVHPWSPLMRGKYATLCLNEVQEIRHFRGLRDRIVHHVLERLFA